MDLIACAWEGRARSVDAVMRLLFKGFAGGENPTSRAVDAARLLGDWIASPQSSVHYRYRYPSRVLELGP